ncbi:hypothetical protein EGW08_017454 [Elysia chlorotica]|uniref:Uncharacterized protein n=1 Tax=Elysia chlorotica TaxID=188477 RepID=A0A3S1B8Q3_ELYCH|nr:hypothetical protein EGW08_017454 [Elysia chlorotica]
MLRKLNEQLFSGGSMMREERNLRLRSVKRLAGASPAFRAAQLVQACGTRDIAWTMAQGVSIGVQSNFSPRPLEPTSDPQAVCLRGVFMLSRTAVGRRACSGTMARLMVASMKTLFPRLVAWVPSRKPRAHGSTPTPVDRLKWTNTEQRAAPAFGLARSQQHRPREQLYRFLIVCHLHREGKVQHVWAYLYARGAPGGAVRPLLYGHTHRGERLRLGRAGARAHTTDNYNTESVTRPWARWWRALSSLGSYPGYSPDWKQLACIAICTPEFSSIVRSTTKVFKFTTFNWEKTS